MMVPGRKTADIDRYFKSPSLMSIFGVREAHEKALREIIAQQGNIDYAQAHVRADDALCTFLEELGFHDLVEAYDKVGKWYA